VVRGGALGDFVLTTPVLAEVRARGHHLTVACNPRFLRPWPELAHEVIDLHAASALWLHGHGPPPARFEAAIVYTPGVGAHLAEHGVSRVVQAPARPPPGISAAASLWRPLETGRPAPAPQVQALPAARARIAALGLPPAPVILAPGAASASKVWPHLGALAQALERAGVPFVWAPGRDEAPIQRQRGRVLPVLDLVDLVALAAEARAWVGNDTGTSHLARAAGCALFSWFGPTDPAVWAPPGAHLLTAEDSPQSIARRLSKPRISGA